MVCKTNRQQKLHSSRRLMLNTLSLTLEPLLKTKIIADKFTLQTNLLSKTNINEVVRISQQSASGVFSGIPEWKAHTAFCLYFNVVRFTAV